ncbi:MAG: hypothetical protein BRD30_10965 [Bacteroidetes bacterium QH_2_63_10]|nr:MAG: hypothetical protein BRD30_10965 [Bacteroidetes bacterium QH_2_63_10]
MTVGSRARDAVTSELAVPVDVYSAEQIERTGTAEVGQILQQISPSANFPRQTVADGMDALRSFTLRGLSPDHTLVLINGKRRHKSALVNRLGSGVQKGSSPVDLNTIPASAINQMEVLRDGAAAKYGSDAIAGVVNVQLKPRSQRHLGNVAGRERTPQPLHRASAARPDEPCRGQSARPSRGRRC